VNWYYAVIVGCFFVTIVDDMVTYLLNYSGILPDFSIIQFSINLLLVGANLLLGLVKAWNSLFYSSTAGGIPNVDFSYLVQAFISGILFLVDNAVSAIVDLTFVIPRTIFSGIALVYHSMFGTTEIDLQIDLLVWTGHLIFHIDSITFEFTSSFNFIVRELANLGITAYLNVDVSILGDTVHDPLAILIETGFAIPIVNFYAPISANLGVIPWFRSVIQVWISGYGTPEGLFNTLVQELGGY